MSESIDTKAILAANLMRFVKLETSQNFHNQALLRLEGYRQNAKRADCCQPF